MKTKSYIRRYQESEKGRATARCWAQSPNGKASRAAAHKRWRDKLPGSFDILNRYGITQEDYAFMLEKQNGVCAICGKVNATTSRRKKLSVDHDHGAPSIIRGLLCNLCNAWLGRIEDNIESVLRTFAYLRRMKCLNMNIFVQLVEKSLVESNRSAFQTQNESLIPVSVAVKPN